MATSMAIALLVSADPSTAHLFGQALHELSVSTNLCPEVPAAIRLLTSQKLDAVIVDLQLGEQSGAIVDELRDSASNRTAVTFGIGDYDIEAMADFRKKVDFIFERPLSLPSIRKTLKAAYGMILRERRRYFRCPISIPVNILRKGVGEVRCTSINVSGGGMALTAPVPLTPGEIVCLQFRLPNRDEALCAESTICWYKKGNLGVRFLSISDRDKSELQT